MRTSPNSHAPNEIAAMIPERLPRALEEKDGRSALLESEEVEV